MQFSNAIAFITITLAASASAAAVGIEHGARDGLPESTKASRPNATATIASLLPRQSQTVDSEHPDEASAQSALDDFREEGRRKLSDRGDGASCTNSACSTCMNSATVASLAEVAACGIVATAAEVGSGGAATVFVVAGFGTCETAIVANMARSVVECEALN